MEQDDETRVRLPFGRAPLVRPPARVFNAAEAYEAKLMCQKLASLDNTPVVQVNSHRFYGGYLEKVVAIKVGCTDARNPDCKCPAQHLFQTTSGLSLDPPPQGQIKVKYKQSVYCQCLANHTHT